MVDSLICVRAAFIAAQGGDKPRPYNSKMRWAGARQVKLTDSLSPTYLLPKEELKAILTVLLLAAGLRFAGITFDSFWLDESYQTLASTVGQRIPDFTAVVDPPFLFHFGETRPLPELLSNFRQVDPLCPPLYPVILNRWITLFGDSDLAVRSLSAVLSTVSVAAIFWCARLMFGPGPALFTALLQTVSPFDIHYAQEARMYSLAILLAALSCGSFFKILSATPIKRSAGACAAALAAYVISTWALINTNYTALFLALFQGLFGLWFCITRRQWSLLALLATAWAAVLILWLPWFDMFRQAAAVRSGSFYVARTPSWWWPVWALVVRIPLNWIVFLAGKKVVAYAVPIYVTSACFLVSALWSTIPNRLSHRLRKRVPAIGSSSESDTGPAEGEAGLDPGSAGILPAPYAATFVWCWAVVPALFVWLVDVIEHHRVIEVSRYVSATAPAIYILAGLGLASINTSWIYRRPSPAVVTRIILMVHVAFALVNNVHDHAVHQREPWRDIAAEVESLCRSDQLILVSQYYDIACLDRYLTQPMLQVGVSPAQGPDHVAKILAGRTDFWLVTAQEGEQITGMIPPHFRPKHHVHLSHGLHLRRYEAAR